MTREELAEATASGTPLAWDIGTGDLPDIAVVFGVEPAMGTGRWVVDLEGVYVSDLFVVSYEDLRPATAHDLLVEKGAA
ncbi:MAG: hypothetical protein CL819_09050 [Croceicoccus sp.]|nr:hypothetical protein [Croceicoccus sp.]